MRLKRRSVGKGVYYSVNGEPIKLETLTAICKEILTAEAWHTALKELVKLGQTTIECKRFKVKRNKGKATTEEPLAILQKVEEKIAALEQKVAELTIENIYLTK